MRMALWYSLEVLVTFYQSFMEAYFVYRFLSSERKKNDCIPFIFCVLLLGSYQVMCDFFFPMDIVSNSLCHSSMLFVYAMFLDGSKVKKIFAAVIPILLIDAVSMVAVFFRHSIYQLVPPEAKVNAGETVEQFILKPGPLRFMALMLSQVLVFLSFQFVLKFYRRSARRVSKINILEPLIMSVAVVVFGVYIYAVQRALYSVMSAEIHYELSILFMITLLVFVLIIVMFLILGKYYERQREMDSIEQNKRYISHELDLMNQAQLKMDCLRHDMKNHLYRIEVLAKEKNTEEILRYVRIGREHLVVDRKYVSTGNKNIDCMLNFKLDRAKNENVVFSTQMALPQELNINSFDINTVLGNLLDNAMEAIEKASAKKLDISIRYSKNTLIIRIGNSFNGKISKDMKTTKANPKRHGLGLQSVQMVVKKYHGMIQYDYGQEYFVTKVLLYNESV